MFAAELLPPNPLSLHSVAKGVVCNLWALRRRLLRELGPLLVIQALLTFVINFLWHSPRDWVLWVPLGLVNLLLTILVAVGCHRIMLLPTSDLPATGFPRWTMRETRFAITTMFLWLALMPLLMLASFLIATSQYFQFAVSSPAITNLVLLVAALPGYYLIGRVALVLPARAIDESLTFGESWDRTAGSGWQMMIVVGLFPSILLSISPSSEDVIPWTRMALEVVYYSFVVAEIAALSLAYKALVADAVVPKEPEELLARM